MTTISIQRKPTQKQKQRLDSLSNDIKVVGWDQVVRGPVLRFPTGVRMAITRDGGLQRM